MDAAESLPMHEMAIAMEIVNHVLHVAAEHDAARVTDVHVTIGAMRQVVPEALQMAFQAAAAGTLAEEARLELTEAKVTAQCNLCGGEFEPDIDRSFLCPECEQADVRIVAGDDILLTRLVCETDEESTP